MSPTEDALLLMRLVERHLGSLRGFGSTNPGKVVESISCFSFQGAAPQPFFATTTARTCGMRSGLARYDSEPTPLPAERRKILELLEELQVQLLAQLL